MNRVFAVVDVEVAPTPKELLGQLVVLGVLIVAAYVMWRIDRADQRRHSR